MQPIEDIELSVRNNQILEKQNMTSQNEMAKILPSPTTNPRQFEIKNITA